MASRTYSFDEAEALLASTWDTLRPWLADISPERYDDASVLDGWNVRDLLAHLARGLDVLTALEAAPRGTDPLSFGEYVGAYPAVARAIASATTALSRELGDDVLAALDAAYARATASAAELRAVDVAVARRGPIRVADLVVSRVLELVVHADDLARSLGLDPPAFERPVLRAMVRVLLDALATAHPGKAVEVRVPPFAAVQCVEGPRHTRGTPPNVIETDAWTWIRLACGRVAWAEALTAHRVSASGTRADLSSLLPLL
jgi:uncharacterized protein (TIGR03083 family)